MDLKFIRIAFIILSVASVVAFFLFGFPFLFLFFPPLLFLGGNPFGSNNKNSNYQERYLKDQYCDNCGMKMQKAWNFCPNCSNPVNPKFYK